MSPVMHKTEWRNLTPEQRRQRVVRSVETTEAFIQRKRLEDAAEKRAARIVAVSVALVAVALMGFAWWMGR